MKHASLTPHSSIARARDLMTMFAQHTGLADQVRPAVRYLWTDAFAVCNFFELFRHTGDQAFKHKALSLIDQVHAVLGKHRDDDVRAGWISGLDDAEAVRHPTAGGLRIGKTLNERPASMPVDSQQEWDRDGQYFHYLSKWIHALNLAARVTGNADYLRWALELAKVAHACFTYAPPFAGARRMHWKMSIDLSRPLVASMGHHDPLDALVTYHELTMTSGQLAGAGALPSLASETAEATAMCVGMDWTTDDPLGLGGLLIDAYRLAQMGVANDGAHSELIEALLLSCTVGLDAFARSNSLGEAVQFRLAFRELGLSIGLHALARMRTLFDEQWRFFVHGPRLRRAVEDLQRFAPLRERIEATWCSEHGALSDGWNAHRDINTVMLATSLIPDGFLSLSWRVPGNSATGPHRPPPT